MDLDDVGWHRQSAQSRDANGRDVRHLKATVSGSFRRHMDAVQDAVRELEDRGVEVLSPSDPRVVDAFGDFVFVASDRLRTVKVVQSRHLAAIEASDFLWVVAQDGYIGPSAAMEIGWACAHGIPVFGSTPPDDLTFRQFVTVVSMPEAMMRLRSPASSNEPSILLSPLEGSEAGHRYLDNLAKALMTPDPVHRERDPEAARNATSLRELLRGA